MTNNDSRICKDRYSTVLFAVALLKTPNNVQDVEIYSADSVLKIGRRKMRKK